MSELKKLTLTVKNYDAQGSGDLDALYRRVRYEDEHGATLFQRGCDAEVPCEAWCFGD